MLLKGIDYENDQALTIDSNITIIDFFGYNSSVRTLVIDTLLNGKGSNGQSICQYTVDKPTIVSNNHFTNEVLCKDYIKDMLISSYMCSKSESNNEVQFESLLNTIDVILENSDHPIYQHIAMRIKHDRNLPCLSVIIDIDNYSNRDEYEIINILAILFPNDQIVGSITEPYLHSSYFKNFIRLPFIINF